MLSLLCSIRSSANDIGRLLSPIFIVKRTVLQIIWLILIIPLCLVFISLMCLTSFCPTGSVMTLLVCRFLKVLAF
ncbi:hypothetical protein LINGRAHAP2_LOCUS26213 [Linum grandiflorum]